MKIKMKLRKSLYPLLFVTGLLSFFACDPPKPEDQAKDAKTEKDCKDVKGTWDWDKTTKKCTEKKSKTSESPEEKAATEAKSVTDQAGCDKIKIGGKAWGDFKTDGETGKKCVKKPAPEDGTGAGTKPITPVVSD